MGYYKIQINSYQYIQDILRFAPATDRQLRRHMNRRTDFQQTIDRLIAEGKIFKLGKGVKSDPYMYYSTKTHIRPAIVSPNI